MQLSSSERRVCDAVAARREALVALTRELVAFDTVTHTPGDAPRQERALQEHLAKLLRSHGAEVTLLQADAAIVPEPSSLAVWVACRGSLLPRVIVRGRAGHAGIAPLPPQQGGAVNAIEKMAIVLTAVERLRDHWAQQPAHPYLSAGDCVPT